MNIETGKPQEENIQPKEFIEKSEIENPEIADLEEPVKKLLEQLKERIDRGDYQLIIGDDASGRIPTRIFETLIKEIYKEKGYPLPETIFFAGSRGLWELGRQSVKEEKIEDMATHIEKVIKEAIKKGKPDFRELEKKALIITDTISSGSSLKLLTEALRIENIDFDIATIGIEFYPYPGPTKEEDLGEKEKNLGARIFYGKEGTPTIYIKPYLSGVTKQSKDVFSKSFKKESLVDESKQEIIQQDINRARKDAGILSEKLIDWYKSLPSKNEGFE